MKRTALYIALPLVILPLLAGTVYFVGCTQAQREVASDNIKKTVDEMVGDLEVKQKEVEIEIRKLDADIKRIATAKHTAAVKADQMNTRIEEVETELAKLVTGAKRVREHMTTVNSGEDVTINGKTYDVAALQSMGQEIIAKSEGLNAKKADFDKAKEELDKVVGSLERKENEFKKSKDELVQIVEKIKTRMIAVKALETTPDGVDDTATVQDRVASAKSKANDLLGELEVRSRIADDEWSADEAQSSINSIDAFINDTTSTSDTLSGLDALIGDEN